MPTRKPASARPAVVRRPRESKVARAARARAIYEALDREHPDATCALVHESPYQLLVATILSAQCTDARVNLVTPEVFRRWSDAHALAAAAPADVENVIRSTGFFRNKARSLIGMAQRLVAEHGGTVPASMEELRPLPGVGRKTANVVLGNAFGVSAGVTVDTHVTRLSRLLALTGHDDAEKIERDLMELFPRERWTQLSHLFIAHGRAVCIANRPRCTACVVNALCPSRRAAAGAGLPYPPAHTRTSR